MTVVSFFAISVEIVISYVFYCLKKDFPVKYLYENILSRQ